MKASERSFVSDIAKLELILVIARSLVMPGGKKSRRRKNQIISNANRLIEQYTYMLKEDTQARQEES